MTEPAVYQGISPAVLGRLLALVVAYDRKFSLEELDVAVFHKVAVDYRWTADEIEKAIHKWGATEAADGFMSPAKLNALIRASRQDVLMRQPIEAPAAPGAEGTVRSRIMAAWVGELRSSKGVSAARKAMIAKHADLVAQFNKIHSTGSTKRRRKFVVTGTPFEQWNGWIAPETVPSASDGATSATTEQGTGYKRNTSPHRAAVVAIAAEAEARETP